MQSVDVVIAAAQYKPQAQLSHESRHLVCRFSTFLGLGRAEFKAMRGGILRPPYSLQNTDAVCRADCRSIETMYIHPAVRFQCAYAGHKGGYAVGMRLVRIVLFVPLLHSC